MNECSNYVRWKGEWAEWRIAFFFGLTLARGQKRNWPESAGMGALEITFILSFLFVLYNTDY